MKNFFPLSIIFFVVFSCSEQKEKTAINPKDDNVHAPYDTAAIDSFSNGAISVDVADRIRRSSVAYQDSIKQEIERQKEEAEAKLLAEEKTKAENEDKKKKEEVKAESKTEAKPSADPEKAALEKPESTN